MSHPEHGGRILLTRETVDEGGARYRVELFTPEERFVGGLRVAEADGAISLDAFDREPPAWLAAAVSPLARTLWTGRQKAPGQPWPRRLHRWRAPKATS